MFKLILVLPIVALLGGCVTGKETLLQLSNAIAVARNVAQQGAAAVCMHYPQVAAAFDTVAVTGVVNTTTVRDVAVAVNILDTNCPAILAGDFKLINKIASTYSLLIKAAEAARRQHAASGA